MTNTTYHNSINQVRSAVHTSRRIMNNSAALRYALISVAGASGLIVLIAALYISNGYRVPAWVYAAGCGIACVSWVIMAWAGRVCDKKAARAIDVEFELNDGVATAIGSVSNLPSEGFTSLQASWVSNRLRDADFSSLRSPPNRWLLVVAIAGPMLATGLGFKRRV